MGYVFYDRNTAATTGSEAVGHLTSAQWVAFIFTAVNSFTVTQAVLRLSRTGSPTFNVDVRIYTDNAGNPGTLIGTGSGTVAASSVATSESDVMFTGLSAAITAGTKYHIVIHCSATQNSSNDLLWEHSFGVAADIVHNSTDGSTWSTFNSSVKSKYTLYAFAQYNNNYQFISAGDGLSVSEKIR